MLHAVKAYDVLRLAQKQLEVAEQSNTTAKSVLDQAKDRFDSGMAVKSYFISAQVNAANRQQELIRAHNGVSHAQSELGIAPGLTAPTSCKPE